MLFGRPHRREPPAEPLERREYQFSGSCARRGRREPFSFSAPRAAYAHGAMRERVEAHRPYLEVAQGRHGLELKSAHTTKRGTHVRAARHCDPRRARQKRALLKRRPNHCTQEPTSVRPNHDAAIPNSASRACWTLARIPASWYELYTRNAPMYELPCVA
jgi:hypothetical protein